MELSESIVLSLLMYLLAIAISLVAAVVVHGIVVIVSRMETPASAAAGKRPVPPPVAPIAVEGTIPPSHVAAITAAVYAVLGAHRIVHIEAGPPGTIWTTEGRLIHQTSHTPRGGR